jgi:hypothetical protein
MSALRKFWLLFAQACTLCVAALFVLTALRPDLLPRLVGRNGNVVLMQETSTPVGSAKVATFADAAKKAMPSVVNIYTTLCSTIRCCASSFPTSPSACRNGELRASVPASSSPPRVSCSRTIT